MQTQTPQPPPPSQTTFFSFSSSKIFKDTKTNIIITTCTFSLLFLLSLSTTYQSTPPHPPRSDPYLFPTTRNPSTRPTPPSLAYFISGSSGDAGRIIRLLYATYHPKNRYLIHLDGFATQTERDQLSVTVQSEPVFRAARNVDVFGKADFAYSKGSSPISMTLHGASVLLRLSDSWDWFVNLNAADYPLVNQDDLLHILSYLPKDLNFVNHTSYIGYRESKRLKFVTVDPGLYLNEHDRVFYATQKRPLPNAYRLFSGSSFVFLSRNFIEHCILGTDNFPRTLLMYLSNTPSSLPNYFPTILCNSPRYNRTIINHNLQYGAFGNSTREQPQQLNSSHFDDMVQSGAAFATHFGLDDPVLDRIDNEILGRSPGRIVPGGWCLGEAENDSCSFWGDADVLRPAKGAKRLEKQFIQLFKDGVFRSRQCVIE